MPNITATNPEISAKHREAYASQKTRASYPSENFLDQEKKRYPYKDPATGAPDKALLTSAKAAANNYGDSTVEKTAAEMLDKNFPDKDEININCDLIPVGNDGKEVFGIVAIPDKPDLDGDVFTKDSILSACYKFNTEFNQAKYRHTDYLTSKDVAIVESYIAPCDMKIGDKEVVAGTWLQRWLIKDTNLQNEIKSGHIAGFSLGARIHKKQD